MARAHSIISDPLRTQSSMVAPGSSLLTPSPFDRRCDKPIPTNTALSLIDVINAVLCHNPQTRETWSNILAQAARVGQSRASYLPTIEGSANYSRSEASADNSVSFDTTGFSPRISLSYLLYDFGGREALVETTEQSLLAANFLHNAALQQLAFRAIQTYYQLFGTRAAVNAALESERASYASYEAASLRHEVGAVAIADKLQAETAYAQAKLEREQAQNQLHIAEGVLASIMGLSPTHPLILHAADLTHINGVFEMNVDQMIEYAKKARPELMQSAAQVAAASANIELNEARALPSFSVSANRDYSYIRSGPGGDSDSSSLVASVRIPFFTGFSDTYKIREAQYALESQEANKAGLERDVALEVWQSYQNYLTARQTLDTTAILVRSAEQSAQVALGRYKQGAGSFLDLLNAQERLADARQQRVNSLYNWLINRADLVRALGNFDFLQVERTAGLR